MADILRDPLWQFVGVVSAIAISVILYYTQKQKKTISYFIITKLKLISLKEECKGKIKILYDSNQVPDVSVLEVIFLNTGNVPILNVDYETPICLSIDKGSSILSADIINSNPTDIKVGLTYEGNNLSIQPSLLNAGDSITLKILTTGFNNFDVSGRIVGVRKIERYEKPRKIAGIVLGAVAFVMVIGIINMVTNYSIINKIYHGYLLWIIALIMIPGYIWILFEDMRTKKYRI